MISYYLNSYIWCKFAKFDKESAAHVSLNLFWKKNYVPGLDSAKYFYSIRFMYVFFHKFFDILVTYLDLFSIE